MADLYGLIGSIRAHPGQRDSLAVILNGIGPMEGCVSYIVALDPADHDLLWVTEVWVTSQAHQDSLGTPQVQDAIAKGRPMIAGFEHRFETVPVGGVGL